MINNSETLDRLMRENVIRARRGSLFQRGFPPKPPEFSSSKVEGMLLGVAIGDALGRPTEGMRPIERISQYGEIKDYLPMPWSDEVKGFPSDDTQLTFWTLEELLDADGLVPSKLALRFTRERIFGIGGTVLRFIMNMKAGASWEYAGVDSAGNGALMRISPTMIPYLKTGGPGIMVDTALCAMITHNNDLSISSCMLFNYLLWQLLDMSGNPAPDWWISQIDHARDIATGSTHTVRGGTYAGTQVQPWDFIQEQLRLAAERDLTVREAAAVWWSGAYLLETVPCALYIMMRHGSDPEQAMIRAVNDTKDNDTIASIVGAMAGALHGADAFPKRWINNLSGRTTYDDDGRIVELMGLAKATWWGREEAEVG